MGERLIEEYTELVKKIVKLKVFIGGNTFKTLETDEQKLLLDQLDHMDGYYRCLNSRLLRLMKQ